MYVGGSVAAGEAWPGESDVDWFTFLTDKPADSDKSWCRETERKLVRNFVLLEGAYVPMLSGDYGSFRQSDVLPRLAAVHPKWQPLVDMAVAILEDPFAAKVSPQTAIEKILPFARWAIEKTAEEEDTSQCKSDKAGP